MLSIVIGKFVILPNQEYFINLVTLFFYKKEIGIAENFSVTTSTGFPKNLRDMWAPAISILFSLVHQCALTCAKHTCMPIWGC